MTPEDNLHMEFEARLRFETLIADNERMTALRDRARGSAEPEQKALAPLDLG